MGFIDQLKAVWPLVTQTPWGFAPIAFAILASGWAVGRFMYSQRIAILKERIEAYKEKLDGASPDEAHAKIERLETRIRDLEFDPRKFNDAQSGKITAALKRHGPGTIIVSRSAGSLECGGVFKQVRYLFAQQGWNVRHWETFDPIESLTGLVFFTNTGDDVSPSERAARDALDAAGIAHEIRRREMNAKEPEPQLVFGDID